ncbi:hypothetical protein SAMN06265360_101156 [Haloechinothrix alba]|uniref:Uncharacterized protein n=2 Tax=Haloechinothrix TaxID=1425377 RepID=A0A238V0F7_9PSEU|nr:MULTISPECIES: hypothetical protein [Haloechinothrix]MBA0124068.1 hypothetical protein [Haloechinothrix aidingensis]SNR28032.1 hypothetical protein SAMN06265360_101156 [Haloechinothrix alba]
MPETTEYREWLDETEQEAYELIARRYDEGRAALDTRTTEGLAEQIEAESENGSAEEAEQETDGGTA